MKFFQVLPKKNILRVHVKDKSCNSLQDLRPVTLLKKRPQNGCFTVNFTIILETAFFIEQFRWLLFN